MKYAENVQISSQLAEVEISYKTKVKPSEMRQIRHSKDLEEICREIFNPSKIEHIEEMMIILLNRAGKMLGWAKISTGGVSGTVCDAKVVFQIALNANASSIVLSHSHPSGSLIPSTADKNLTSKIKEAGNFLDIEVIDHIIITSEGYMSFADEGLM